MSQRRSFTVDERVANIARLENWTKKFILFSRSELIWSTYIIHRTTQMISRPRRDAPIFNTSFTILPKIIKYNYSLPALAIQLIKCKRMSGEYTILPLVQQKINGLCKVVNDHNGWKHIRKSTLCLTKITGKECKSYPNLKRTKTSKPLSSIFYRSKSCYTIE